jgi:hypothetical protein
MTTPTDRDHIDNLVQWIMSIAAARLMGDDAGIPRYLGDAITYIREHNISKPLREDKQP